MNILSDIAQKLLEPANILFQEHISFQEYLTELTWLLFLKVAPAYGMATYTYFNWDVFVSQTGQPQFEYYKKALAALEQAEEPHIASLFTQAQTALQRPEQLLLITASLAVIDKIDIDNLGELYETLLELCFSQNDCQLSIVPRSLADMMVVLTQPQPDELIQDPLAGVGNLLVAADQYVQTITAEEIDESSFYIQEFDELWRMGIEPQLTKQRFAMMNCLLHDFDYLSCIPVQWGDTLKNIYQTEPPADVILSVFAGADEDTCLALLQHTCQRLAPGGRAAVVVHDSILTAPGPAQQVRRLLLNNTVVHTVLRLPLGIFYPQNLLTHLLFFRKGDTVEEKTQNVWFYDMRSQFPKFGPHLQLTPEHLRPFEIVYGEDPWGHSPRQEVEINGRWRCVSRRWLAQQNDQLAFCWLAENRQKPVKQRWGILDSMVTELQELGMLLT